MNKVCLVTTTFYSEVDHPRLREAERTLKTAREMRIPMIVVDGSPVQVKKN